MSILDTPSPGRTSRLLVVACAWLVAACDPAGEERPRNLVLVSIDTLRPDHLGCYGHGRATSPTIDRLAEEGVLFEDVTSASPWTLPSHASMLTGLYPSRHGVKDHVNRLADGIPSLATRLAGAGFQTMAVVNSHNLSERYGLDQGFDSFRYVSEWDEGKVTNRGPAILDQAEGWLRARDARPFFLFLHFYDVHTDFDPSPASRALLVRPYAGEIDGGTAQLLEVRNGTRRLDTEDVRHLCDLYDAEIRDMDGHLARLEAFLEAQGLADETLLVITSDHGEEYLEHGAVLHGRTYYQEVIAIPLILHGPGVPAGRRVSEPASLVDVAPTVLSLLGVPVADGAQALDGVDLTCSWSPDAPPIAGRLLFAEADHNNLVNGEKVSDVKRMLRVETHKLHYDRVDGRMELYDLARDPAEQDDLSAREPERAAALLKRVQAFLEAERRGERIAPPSDEEEARLRALGY